jgi:hypothetical protein
MLSSSASEAARPAGQEDGRRHRRITSREESRSGSSSFLHNFDPSVDQTLQSLAGPPPYISMDSSKTLVGGTTQENVSLSKNPAPSSEVIVIEDDEVNQEETTQVPGSGKAGNIKLTLVCKGHKEKPEASLPTPVSPLAMNPESIAPVVPEPVAPSTETEAPKKSSRTVANTTSSLAKTSKAPRPGKFRETILCKVCNIYMYDIGSAKVGFSHASIEKCLKIVIVPSHCGTQVSPTSTRWKKRLPANLWQVPQVDLRRRVGISRNVSPILFTGTGGEQ